MAVTTQGPDPASDPAEVLPRTVVEYGYSPADYFEAPVLWSSPEYRLRLEDGLARATLGAPADPVEAATSNAVRAQVQAHLSARQLRTHRPFKIDGPRIEQHRADGRRDVTVALSGAIVVVAGGSVDFVLQDASGRVVRDSKAERIAEEQAFMCLIANAGERHPLVAQLLGSYNTAVANPETELVHLYEIRDALQKYFKGAQKARKRLGITKRDWKRLGALADTEALEEGRHRGQHLSGCRPATPAERQEARGIARRLIEAFARSI